MRFKVHHCTKFHGEPLLSYGNLTFYFQNGIYHFAKIQIFNGIYHFAKIQIFNWVQFRGPVCDTCKILWRLVKPLLWYGDFFDSSKMSAVRHLYLLCACLDRQRRVFGCAYHCTKFDWNWRSSLENIAVIMCRSLTSIQTLLRSLPFYCISYVLYNASEFARHSQKCPFPWVYLHPYLVHGFLCPPNTASKLHLDQYSHFCTVHHGRECL